MEKKNKVGRPKILYDTTMKIRVPKSLRTIISKKAQSKYTTKTQIIRQAIIKGLRYI